MVNSRSTKSNVYINIFIMCLVIFLLFIVLAALHIDTVRIEEASGDLLEIHFIDVGQANASVLIGPEFTIVVDTGHYKGDEVVAYLDKLGIGEIDLLVGTHPHADHIGQFDKVLDHFLVKEVWMSGDIHTTQTYERAIDAVIRSNANYYEPRTGEAFQFGSLQVEVLHPDMLTGKLHEGCIALKLIYKEFSLLLTGDIEKPVEQRMIDQGLDLTATILELGHHGSRTSSSSEFLKAVAPEMAIYSAGVDNEYGHPHREIIDRLAKINIPVYGTDHYGTIIIQTDGYTYELFLENE